MKKNKGITLIALIITIVIMLILLGLGTKIIVDNKIFTKTQIAVNKTNNRIKNDDAETNYLLGELDNTKQKQCSHIWGEEKITNQPTCRGSGAQEKICTKCGQVEETYLPPLGHNYENGTCTRCGKLFSIQMELTHQDIEIPTDTTKYTLTSENVPIPTGYYYVGGTKDTGIVISDSANDANKGDSHEVSNTLQGNQFVWVPVLQNQKIKIDITADENITHVELIDPLGESITTSDPNEKTYTASVDPTINGSYILIAATESDADYYMLDISTLYARDFGYLSDSSDFYTNEIKRQYIDNYGIDANTVELYKNSVNKYGGFYIARYEAGCNNERTYGDTTENVTVFSQANKYPYYYINQTDSITKAAEIASGKTNVTAGLMNAAAFDRTVNWLIETQAITKDEEYDSWGNYQSSTFSFIGKYHTNGIRNFTESTELIEKPANQQYLLGTGVSEYTKKNNIYDLSGNCKEWTTETSGTVDSYITLRGRSLF